MTFLDAQSNGKKINTNLYNQDEHVLKIEVFAGYSSLFNILCCKKGKSIPITGHEGLRGMWIQGYTYTQPRP